MFVFLFSASYLWPAYCRWIESVCGAYGLGSCRSWYTCEIAILSEAAYRMLSRHCATWLTRRATSRLAILSTFHHWRHHTVEQTNSTQASSDRNPAIMHSSICFADSGTGKFFRYSKYWYVCRQRQQQNSFYSRCFRTVEVSWCHICWRIQLFAV